MNKFSDWLRTYRAGVIDDLLTASLNEVAPAVGLHQKKGSVTLKLEITSTAGGVVVVPVVKHETPQPPMAGEFHYVTDPVSHGFALSRRDPNQPALPGMNTMEDQQ